MDKRYKRCACGLLAGVLALLTAAAAVVFAVDPAFYFRMPADGEAVFFNERYQSAGLAKHIDTGTVLLGTSMAANYRGAQIEAVFGGTALRITIPDGYFSEFDQVMDAVFRSGAPERVVFVLDMNILVRDEAGVTDAMPGYLYNDRTLDDLRYLLNKDVLYYSGYTLLARHWGESRPLEEGFTMQGVWWNHLTALEAYERPAESETQLSANAYLETAASNLAVVESWISENPETEFDLVLAPYSVLYWDKTGRLGQTEAVFSALELICQRLTGYDNVKLFAPLMDREIVEDLDQYCDYIHHSEEICGRVLQKIAAEEDRLTAENYRQTLANWQTFVVDYDYEKFWDVAFWESWNAARAKT